MTRSSGLEHHGREDKARPAEAAPGGGKAPRTGPDPAGGTRDGSAGARASRRGARCRKSSAGRKGSDPNKRTCAAGELCLQPELHETLLPLSALCVSLWRILLTIYDFNGEIKSTVLRNR